MLRRHLAGLTRSFLPLSRVARSLYWLTQKARWGGKLTLEPIGHYGFSTGGKKARLMSEQEKKKKQALEVWAVCELLFWVSNPKVNVIWRSIG